MVLLQIQQQRDAVAALFEGWEETLIWSCLSGSMGKIYADDAAHPRCAAAIIGDFSFLAGAAELYGYVNAGMWTVMPQLERLTRMPDPRIHTEIDFDAERTKVSGQVGLSLQIRDMFTIGWAFAGPMVKWFMAMRKRRRRRRWLR